MTWGAERSGRSSLKTHEKSLRVSSWFKQNLPPGGSCQYIDAVAWFATHSKDPNGTWDYTASNLLNHLTFPAQHQLTAVGVLWRDTTCFNCQCASPNCP